MTKDEKTLLRQPTVEQLKNEFRSFVGKKVTDFIERNILDNIQVVFLEGGNMSGKRMIEECPNCHAEIAFLHLHDSPYGLYGAHDAGSERFQCPQCHHVLSRLQAIGLGLEYILDKD